MTSLTERLSTTSERGSSALDAAQVAGAILDQIDRVIVGKRAIGRLLLACVLAEGHVLLEDVPGVGKTTLARSLAVALGGQFHRIQFTPDLLPSDITGLNYFDQKSGDFRFRAGPVFANVVVADEINRATPRTQSALLEAMEERTVTVEGETLALPRPFLVIATENPIELEGTFPLPEAQIDRFMMRLKIGYPSEDEEMEIIARSSAGQNSVESVATPEQIERLIGGARDVHISGDVTRYIARLTRATRAHPVVRLGASPRASIALARAAQAFAVMSGRSAVIPDDVKAIAPHVLTHRIDLAPEAMLRGRTAESVVSEVLDSEAVPVEGSIGLSGDQ
ncbi:MAG: MoxR family ATPase [Thermomicrobiales bacterium]|nr:MoxR family ATPase [Thermomicrobiales bacterium]